MYCKVKVNTKKKSLHWELANINFQQSNTWRLGMFIGTKDIIQQDAGNKKVRTKPRNMSHSLIL
jgi:hypothetical protein